MVTSSLIHRIKLSTGLLYLLNQPPRSLAFVASFQKNAPIKPVSLKYREKTTFHNSISPELRSTSNDSAEGTIYERVLSNPQWPPEWPFTDTDFIRQDESDDGLFYESPRL